MKLSSIYEARVRWAMVYHIYQDSEIVEFVRDKFFKSKKAAWKWFHRKFKESAFVQPEAVQVMGFGYLTILRDKSEPQDL